MIKESVYLIFICLFLSFNSKADLDLNIESKTVNVTASRIELNQDEIANSLSVIEKNQIDLQNGLMIQEHIDRASGVEVLSQGGMGKKSSVFIRGSNPEHTLVLVDGIPVNDPISVTGSFDLSRFTDDNIERIEILKGPQSVMYGSGAMGGVINLITKKDISEEGAKIKVEFGSYETQKLGIHSYFKLKGYSVYSSASQMISDGYSIASKKYGNDEKDGFYDQEVSFDIKKIFQDKSKISFSYLQNKAQAEQDKKGGLLGDDLDMVENSSQRVSKISYKNNYLNNNFETEYTLGMNESKRSNLNSSDLQDSASSFDQFYGKNINYGFQGNYYFENDISVSLGLDIKSESGHTNKISSIKTTDEGLFLQSNFDWNNLFGSIGQRIDRYSLNNKSVTTFRASMGYHFVELLSSVRGSVSTGFKNPTLYQLYDPTYGNLDLKPEEVSGYEIAYSYQKNKLKSEIIYFNNDYKNLFSYDSNTFKSINLNKAQISGWEFVNQFKLKSYLDLSLNYTYLDKFINLIDKEKLVRRPRNSISINANWNYDSNSSFYVNYKVIGDRIDYDSETFERGKLKQYELVGLGMKYKLSNQTDAGLKINNLLDKKYEEISGYGTEGLSFYLSLNMKI